jgi:hypothetical protein
VNATFDRRRPTARACRRFACLLSLAAVGVRTQESSAPILRVGEHALGELVLAGDRTDSPFRVVAPRGESIVLSVESVDFDAAISVEVFGV